MCGICGIYSTSLNETDHKLFRKLLLLNVWRGHHSTGVVRMKKKGNKYAGVKTQRSTRPSPEYVFHPDAQDILNHSATDTAFGLIGHTRHATKGTVSLKNAHPFGFDSVVGVHNGTITLDFKGSKKYDTDSEALYKLINDEGIVAALKEIQYKSGAYVLVYVNKKEGTLNIVRNSKRPLYFTYVYNKSTLIWSSLKEDLEYIVDKEKLVAKGWDNKTDDFFTLNPNEMLTIKIGEPATSAKITSLGIKEPVVHSSGYGRVGSHYNPLGFESAYGDDDWADYTDPIRKTEEKEEGPEGTGADLATLPWLDKPAKPVGVNEGEPESDGELTFRLSQGCFCCGNVVTKEMLKERARVHWWGREHYACGDCYENVDGNSDWVWRSIEDDWESEEPPKVQVH